MAERICVKAAAKINLALDVTGILPNGYHAIESVFQNVAMYDTVTVELCPEGITVSGETPDTPAFSGFIPYDGRNIAYKAAKAFFEENGMTTGCRIHIKKGIPSQAGMGGGSADAAAVLYCLGRLTGRSFSAPEKLGADVPFFLTGGTAYVEGIGERIAPIADYSGRILVIAKGTEGVSTAEAYQKIDALGDVRHPETKKLAEAINSSPDEAYRYFGNLFEDAVQLDEVNMIKASLLSSRAKAACMTGSGSAVFGLFGTYDEAERAAAVLTEKGCFAQVCETVSRSVEEVTGE